MNNRVMEEAGVELTREEGRERGERVRRDDDDMVISWIKRLKDTDCLQES